MRCIVTGANSGLGRALCLGLAKAGAEVIMVCRNEQRGQQALQEIQNQYPQAKLTLDLADLSSQSDLADLSKTLHERYSSIDVLINNAGLVLDKKQKSVNDIEMTLATNHLAPMELSNLLVDLLQASGQGRVVNVSSAIHRWGSLDLDDLEFTKRRYWGMRAYAQSKLLLTISSFDQARRFKAQGVTVNCFHPGAVKTQLGSSASNSWFLKILDKLIKSFFLSPEKAAQTGLTLALDPALAGKTGLYYSKGQPVKADPRCYDLTLAFQVGLKSATYFKN